MSSIKKIFSTINLVRFGLFIGAMAAIVAMLPRNNRTTFSYNIGEPWRYSLLLAPFDIEVYNDSAKQVAMKDSIDRYFVPYVSVDKSVSQRAKRQILSQSPAFISSRLEMLIDSVYAAGIIDQNIQKSKLPGKNKHLRTYNKANNTSNYLNATDMRTVSDACVWIADNYSFLGTGLPEETLKALQNHIAPNIIFDKITNDSILNNEYANVSRAQGIIRSGQRIVDKGEEITPQIYTNLQTYQKKLEKQDNSATENIFILGQIVFIFIIFATLYIYLASYRSNFFSSPRKMTFLMLFITLFSLLTIVLSDTFSYGIYLSPFAAVPVIILIFFDSRTAIFSLITTVLLCSLVATYQFQFIFMEIIVGLVAAFSIHQLSKRSQLLRTSIFAFFTYAITYTASIIIETGSLETFHTRILIMFAINSILLSFAYILIFVIEKTFGFTSTVTLVELSDINNPLLRKLAEEAPGTFQHSMQVSTLAAEAARAIGANTQLVRTGALYHDIGKMESPIFFTENQHGINPHNGLDPETSAKQIISHVTKGLARASKEKLPQVIRNFISEHHGRGVTKYFYNTVCNNHPDEEIDPTPYTYPGPNPQSKETAILMMADAVEAASRSLREYTSESIDNLVNKIIDGQMADGLLRESPISFRDVEIVKETFKKRLGTIYHSRVAYPDRNKA